MGLDLTKLEKVRRQGLNIIARCPACAETGGDRKGEHLFINDRGQFGCVLYPGVNGQTHRQRIFKLAGVKEMRGKVFEIRKPSSSLILEYTVIQKDILGHLGHIKSICSQKNLDASIKNSDDNLQEDLYKSVPNVPEPETEYKNKVFYTPEEGRLFTGIYAESLEKVHIIKDFFYETVIDNDNNVHGVGTNKFTKPY